MFCEYLIKKLLKNNKIARNLVKLKNNYLQMQFNDVELN